MVRKSKQYKFNVIVNLPTDEKRAEYDQRVGKAIAKTLMEILPANEVDKLIESYKSNK